MRVPAVPVVASAVAIALVVVGAVVVHSVSSGASSHHDATAVSASGVSASSQSPVARPTPTKSATSADGTTDAASAVPSVPSGTAFFTSGANGGLAITPAEAQTVALGLWARGLRAFDDGSADELRQVEGGVALASDLNYLAQQPADERSCDCLDDSMLQPTSAAAIVPPALSYPASFIGEVGAIDEDNSGVVDVFVVTRNDAASPWRITLYSGFATSGDATTFGSTGWSDPSHDTSAVDGQLGRLAALWQRAKDGDVSHSAGFDSGSWLVGYRLANLVSHRQDAPQADGLRGHFTFAVDPATPAVVVGFDGGALICGAIRQTAVYTPAPGHAIVQHPNQRDFGLTVPAGRYSQITDSADWQVCVGQTRAGLIVPIGFDASLSGVISGTPLAKGSALSPDPAQVLTVEGSVTTLLDGGWASVPGGSDGGSGGGSGGSDGGSGGGSTSGGAPVSFTA